MPRLKSANLAKSRLARDIDQYQNFMYVVDSSKFPEPPFRVVVNNEIIEVGGLNREANIFTNLQRGLEGTTASFHAAGSFVENVFTAGTYEELADQEDIQQLTEEFNEHLNDDAQHVTQSERDAWNSAEANAKNYTDGLIGALSSLLTNAKNTIVAAINEIVTSLNEKVSKSGDTMTGNLTLPAIDGDWFIPDTRDVPINPNDLQRRVSVDFKSGSTIGLSGSPYFVVYTIRPWNDDSGGVTHQVAFGNNGVFHRKSSGSSWGAWNKILDETGGTLKGILTAYSNTSYTTRQIRNIILSTSDPNISAMQDGDIWIKYK